MKQAKTVRGRATGLSKKGRVRWPLITSSILGILLAITFGFWWYRARVSTNELIARDVAQLSDIFRRINDECGIVGFAHKVNYVDFLTVDKFVGSEVGSMNVRDPKKWQGPYVKDNPTIQTKLYEIVRTNKGYFLVPGTDVKLSGGAVMGTGDLMLDENSDIQLLISEGKLAHSGGSPLAAQIMIA